MAGPGKAHCTVTQAIALFLAAVLLHQVLKDRVPPFQSQTHAVVPEPLTSPDGAAPAGPGAARDAAGGGPTNRPAPQSEAGGEAGPSAPRARADGERKRASDAPGGDAAAAPGARGPPATDDARPRARARDGGRAAEEAGAPWTPPDSSTFYRVIREGGPAERRRLLRRLEGPTSPPLTVAVSMCDYSWIEFCENMAYHHRQHLPRTPLLMHVMDRRAMEWCAGRLSKRMRVVCVYPPMSTAHKKRGCRYDPNDDAFWERQQRQMSGKWIQIVGCKMQALLLLVEAGASLFFEDSDAALLRDPFRFLPLNHSWEGACHGREAPPVRNTGMMFLRAGPRTAAVLNATMAMVMWPGGNDQEFFNIAANRRDGAGRALDSWCAPLDSGGGKGGEAEWGPRARTPGALWHVHATGYKTQFKKPWLQKYGVWKQFE